MAKDFDFRIMRFFSATLFGTLFFTAMKLILWLFQGSGGGLGVSIFQSSNAFMLSFFFLEDLAVIGVFFCVYRMAGFNVWFDISGTMFLCLLFSKVITVVVEWLIDYMSDKTLGIVILYTLEVLPQIFLMLGVFFILNGVIQLQVEMKSSTKKILKYKKLRLYWVFAGAFGFLASLIQRLFNVADLSPSVQLYIKLGAAMMITFYLVICIWLSISIRGFCHEYYMYRYNRGIGGGSGD